MLSSKNVKKSIKWFWHHRGPVPIPWRRSHDCWMLLYPDDQGIAIMRNEEGPIRDWAWNYLKPGMQVYDVGAGQGSYTILFAKKGCEVVAFEPVGKEVRRLKRNLYLNGVRNRVKVVSKAVGREYRSLVELYVPKGSESRSSLHGAGISRPVSMISLDKYADDGKIDLLKIDAEGGELDILQGAWRIFTKDRPALIVEIADEVTRGFGYRGQDLVDRLEEWKYELWEFQTKEEWIKLERKNWYETTVVGLPR